MTKILLVSDETTVLEDLRSVLDDGTREIEELRDGLAVRPSVAVDAPDLIVADSQVQAMGGFAICLDVKLESSAGRIPEIPVLVLLDRRADVFLARRAGADGFVVKPLDPLRLRRAVDALLEGGTFHDESFRPFTAAAH